MSKKKVESCISRLLMLEILFSIILFLIIQFQMVAKLWDQTFLDYIIRDWARSPIVDVKSYKAIPKPTCLDLYEPIAVKFAGTKASCKCSLEITYDGVCSQEQIDEKGCTSIEAIEPTDFQIMNDKYYCSRRDKNYNLNNMKKPTQDQNKWQCNDEIFSKLCGDSISDEYENQYCIPTLSECAITDVVFDSDGDISPIYDLKLSNPILDIVPSQGTGLCIYYKDYTNTQKGKIQLEIMNDEYKTACPVVQFNEHDFRTQKLHKKIPVFEMNEKTLFQQNLNGKVLTILKDDLNIGKEVFNKMETYQYQMFKVEYHPWSKDCKGSQGQQITHEGFKDQIYTESYSNVEYTDAIRWIIAVMLFFKITIFCTPNKQFKCRIAIRLLNFCGEVASMVLLSLLYITSGNNYFQELAQLHCTEDPIFKANLIQIANFKQSLAEKSQTAMAFLSLIMLSEIFSIIYRCSNDCYGSYQDSKDQKFIRQQTVVDYLSNHSDTESESKWKSFEIK